MNESRIELGTLYWSQSYNDQHYTFTLVNSKRISVHVHHPRDRERANTGIENQSNTPANAIELVDETYRLLPSIVVVERWHIQAAVLTL